MIEIKSLVKIYEDGDNAGVKAVNDISFNVEEGRFYTLFLPPSHRDGFSKLCHLAAYDGVRKRRVSAAGRQAAAEPCRDSEKSFYSARTGRVVRLWRTHGNAIVRRSTAAAGAGPCAGAGTAGPPAGRTVEQSRRQTAGTHALRITRAAAPSAHHDPLRDPRSGRGVVDVQYHRRHELRRDRSRGCPSGYLLTTEDQVRR